MAHRNDAIGSWLSLPFLLLAVACGGGGGGGGVGTAETCAGEYAGTYSGSYSGTLEGTLLEDGTIEVTFREEGSSTALTGLGELQAGGAIEMDVSGNTVTGTLDGTCRATGNWDYSGFASGTWEMSRVP